MMRFRGGGVGHKAVCEATNEFLNDRDGLDIKQDHEAEMAEDSDEEMLVELQVEDPPVDDVDMGDPEDEDSDDEEMSDSEGSGNEQHEDDSDSDESDSDLENEGEDNALGAEDGEDWEDELELLGYGNL
jgi:hypothetical protein